MSFIGRKLLNASLNRSTNVCLAAASAFRTKFLVQRPSSTAEFHTASVASNVPDEVTENTADVLYKRLEVEVRGHDPAVLKSYEWFATTAAKHLNINLSRTWVPDVHKLRRRALKSAFVHGKHIVHYEFRTYFRVMEFKRLTGSTADTFLEYIQRNLPEGVAMKVTKERIEKIPTHINTQSNN